MMDSQPAIDFRFTEVAQHPERLSQIRYLLTDSGLGMDNDITLFVEAWSGRQLVGCAGWPPTLSNAWRSMSSCAV
jgi:[citrate (pro-3S)-lyase] ligase